MSSASRDQGIEGNGSSQSQPCAETGTHIPSSPQPQSYLRREVIGEAVLYLGDCAQIMPTLTAVDAVLTDPPYGIDYGRAGGFSASHGWGQWRENVAWDKERPARELFDAMLACSKDQIIWGGNYFTDFLPPTMQWLVWDKGQRDFSLADCEFAWSNQQRAARILNYARGKAIRDGKEHPTQKPIEVMVWCLSFIPKAKAILDPFMGSGTTGVACAQLGRAFVGIEREPAYFDIACRRIAESYRQPRLFAEAAPKPIQPTFQLDAIPDEARATEPAARPGIPYETGEV